MAMWLQDIPWLTEEERDVFEDYRRLFGSSGFLTRNEKRSRFFTYLWASDTFLMALVMAVTIVHYADKFDMMAYSFHHFVLIVDNTILIGHFWYNREGVRFIFDAASRSYDYKSKIVEEYSKNLVRERLKLLRFFWYFIIACIVACVTELQVFYITETAYFKSFHTMWPVYVGLDLNEWPVYLFIVAWQETITVVTTLTLTGSSGTIAITAWSHLDIEIKILRFAISNVERITDELKSVHGDGQESRVYQIYCNHLAKHHASIIAYFRTFSRTMVFFLFVLFSSGFMITVCVGLAALSDNLSVKLKLMVFLVLQTAVIYGWCWIGQNISDQGAEISELIVSAKWWLMPKSCSNTLRLIMIGCTIPLVLTTPFGTQANNECFMDLMKGAYQMVNVLYQATH